jgi:hypothetical protein
MVYPKSLFPVLMSEPSVSQGKEGCTHPGADKKIGNNTWYF